MTKYLIAIITALFLTGSQYVQAVKLSQEEKTKIICNFASATLETKKSNSVYEYEYEGKKMFEVIPYPSYSESTESNVPCRNFSLTEYSLEGEKVLETRGTACRTKDGKGWLPRGSI